jgi:hypothetical protein
MREHPTRAKRSGPSASHAVRELVKAGVSRVRALKARVQARELVRDGPDASGNCSPHEGARSAPRPPCGPTSASHPWERETHQSRTAGPRAVGQPWLTEMVWTGRMYTSRSSSSGSPSARSMPTGAIPSAPPPPLAPKTLGACSVFRVPDGVLPRPRSKRSKRNVRLGQVAWLRAPAARLPGSVS